MRRSRMSFRLLFLCSSMLVEPAAHGQITPDNEWFACKVDSECVVEKDACALREIVNRRYVNQYRTWKTEIHAVMGCELDDNSGSSNPQRASRPICSKGRCSLAVAKVARAR